MYALALNRHVEIRLNLARNPKSLNQAAVQPVSLACTQDMVRASISQREHLLAPVTYATWRFMGVISPLIWVISIGTPLITSK